MKNLSRLGFLLFLLVGFVAGMTVSAALTQIVETGIVTGVVRDKSGAVIPGAHVSIGNNATALTSTAVTDSQGLYVSPPLDPGDYTVEFAASGFGKVQEHVRVDVGGRVAVDSVLTVAETT